MGVVGWGSPLLLIFCILGWKLGVHVFRLLDSQTAPFQLLAKHQVPDSLQCGAVCEPSYAGAKAVHIPDYTVIPAPLSLHY